MLGNSKRNISQPVEIHYSKDEKPPQLVGGKNEKELKENDEGELEEETKQSGQEEGEETEKHSESPLQNPLQEDELAQILANMAEYVQSHSPLKPHTEEGPQELSAHDKSASEELCDEEEEEEDHSAHDKSVSWEKSDENEEEEKSVPSQKTLEELHDEEEIEEVAAQETTKQTRVSTPKKPNQHNTEEVSQEGTKEVGQGKGTMPEVQSLGLRKQTLVPSKKTKEIKILRKEQQRFLNVIKKLRQHIRFLKMGKKSKGTSVAKHATTQAQPHKKKTKKTQVQPVIQNQKE